MEAEVTYIAKDGKTFKDALQCQEYEKTIGVVPYTVADVILELDKLDDSTYIFGIVFIRHRKDDSSSIYAYCTVCIDEKLESFVNVNNLTAEQRYITGTVGELKDALRMIDKDDWAQYMIAYSPDIELKHPVIMASHNPKVWKDNASNGK